MQTYIYLYIYIYVSVYTYIYIYQIYSDLIGDPNIFPKQTMNVIAECYSNVSNLQLLMCHPHGFMDGISLQNHREIHGDLAGCRTTGGNPMTWEPHGHQFIVLSPNSDGRS